MVCKNCGSEINENSKFCTTCGTEINNDNSINTETKNKVNNDVLNEENTTENSPYDKKEISSKKKSVLKKVVLGLIAVLVLSVMGVTCYKFFYNGKVVSTAESKSAASIEIKEIKLNDYPTINIYIKATGYSGDLDVNNISLKEDDAYKKLLKLTKDTEEGQYILTYSTDLDTQNKEKKVSIFYNISGKEISADSKYIVSETNNEQNTNSFNNTNEADNFIDTSDDSEKKIKELFKEYHSNFIRTINFKDISYVSKNIDLSGNLSEQFADTVSSYEKQNITENLIDNKIEKISKIDNTRYEVITYEKYYIYYGVENKSKYADFRTSYTVTKNGNTYKVYSINKIDKISSKEM